MNRKEFLKLIGTATAGTPFMLNGFTTRAMRQFLDFPINCDGVNERVLVIVRLFGANDGLNTVIPLSQYSTYANLRPTIKINETGTGSYINLDSTLSAERLSGLHPSMTGFKNLYDSGKLAVLPGVGYPTPNYSHFRGEDLMFSGKDGASSQSLRDGIFGRYLAALYPGMAGNPTSERPDPLAIQLGNLNPNLFYGHSHENNIEYNLTGFQNTLFGNLTPSFNIPLVSEHQDLLNYIKEIEVSMDTYYNRVNAVFNAGSNSTVTYPNTDLGKQLKTVARLIKGGSKTKIFQVNIGSFDTHVSQIETGASHLGSHAVLLADVSNSIAAFQSDLENLGLSNKVLTATFSEFGRQVRQNANRGTDHGDLSPFFVLGSNINPGVYANHPIFTDTTSFFYSPTEIKYDYRQIFATLMQDWLGANDQLMTETELNTFSGLKIPFIQSGANASNGCLIGPLISCEETITAVKIADNQSWSYYGVSGTTDYLFAIQHLPPGGNTNTFTATITFKKNCIPNTLKTIQRKSALTKEGMFAAGYYWNIEVTSGSVNGFVNMRFFPVQEYLDDLSTAATNFFNFNQATYLSNPLYIKTNNPLMLPNDFRLDGKGMNYAFTPLLVASTGSYTGKSYVQFNNVSQLHNSGGALIQTVNSMNENTLFMTPQQALDLKGTIRYNNKTKRIEGFDGTDWRQFN